jgi:thioredoxin-like negative regulator of GroEL
MQTAERIQLLFVTRRTSGVARRMESIIATLQTRNRGRVAVRTIDADAEPQLVKRLGVRDAPAVLFVRDRRPVARLQGRVTLDELERILEAC